jgi:hypothetical protein
MNGPHSIAGVRAAVKRASRPHRTIVTGDPLAVRRSRLTDRLLARLFGASLDHQLAAGRPPESSPRLAARAQHIVAIRTRRQLAHDWENLLRRARRAHGAYNPAIPVRSERIAAAEPDVHELMRRLAAPLPVPARGVAMATVLLTDALSPVYSSRSGGSLPAALEAAIAELDPAVPLMTGAPVSP